MLHRFRHRILAPVLIAWLVLTVAGLIMRWGAWDRLTHSLDAAGAATRLEESLSQLFSDLQEAESSQRGYVLTGNEDYLEPFQKTETSLASQFHGLEAMVMLDPALGDDLLKLKGLTDIKMNEMRETIKVRHDKSLKEAAALVNSGKGKDEMDQIRKVMWQMRQRRENLSSLASENTRQNLEWTQTIGLFLGYLGLGAGLLSLYLVRVGLAQERAQRKLLEEKLGAERVVLEKSAFLANMSHEIRTPMNAILGFSELLEGESFTTRQAQYVRSIRESGVSLLQLINDVLDLSKMEAGKLELHLEPTDLREICNFLETMFGQQATQKLLQLQIEVDPMPQALLLDRLRLRQILVNLVGNAIKFTLKGRVSMRVKWQPHPQDRSRGCLLIEVADTGVGISPEKQEEIFKPFVQSSSHRDLEHQGTGLGLSIVQRLTQMMGGSIAVESNPGAGSSFRLQFPDVSVSSRLPISDFAPPNGSADFNDFVPSTILVVDDNQTNRELMIGLFEGTHHRLRLASNGHQALASIDEMKPSLVLLDIRMPVMDGRATLAKIREQPGLELLPVVAVTASSHAHDEQDLRKWFSGYVRKPFSRQRLYEELAQFLPRKQRPPEPPSGNGAGGPVSSGPTAVLATARSAITPEAAAAELLLLQQNQWPGLCDSMAINETVVFAQRLRYLAQMMQSKELTTYADRLAAHAQAYAVGDLERSLAEFPAVIRALEPTREKN